MANRLTRRSMMTGLGAIGAAGAAGALSLGPSARAQSAQPLLRTIPSTGVQVPAIGMGTWITFNVGADEALRKERAAVLQRFFDDGGGMVDSSPMYGTSEDVIGYCLERVSGVESLFSASKIWSPLQAMGEDQLRDSFHLWGVDKFDLMQVHNLMNWDGHLETLKAAKQEGRVRHIGITTSHGRRHGELEEVMRAQPLDFVQLTYNIADRVAENRLLPLAADRGIAVLANRPFQRKALIRQFQDKPLPAWAEAEAGAKNWPEFLLKFILSHPAVTCAIPATTQVQHMAENMAAMHGPLPDQKTRQRMVRYVEGL